MLFLSTRRDGRSLGDMIRSELGPVPGTIAGIGILLICIILLAGAGAGRGEGAGGQPVGHVHRVLHHPDRPGHGRLQPLHPSRPHRRDVADRRRPAAGGTGLRQDRVRDAGTGRMVQPARQHAGADHHRLRLRRLGAADLAAARAARLPVHLHEGRHRPAAGGRHHGRAPRSADAGDDKVRGRHRPGLGGEPVPVPVHHHRLRSGFRLARADLVRHHAEDDRERVTDPPDRLRRHADGVVRRDHGDDRRHGDPSRRLFRHEQRRRDHRHGSGAGGAGDHLLGLHRHA